MATLNQKLALNAKLHKALHKNIYLLSIYYPMSKDLQVHYKEGMLEKPNSAAFHHLSFYLMSIIDPKHGSSSTSWAMFEIKIESKYRTEFLKFANETSKEHDGHISHIMASWLVNAGGVKVAKLMFELSQVALKVHLQRRQVKNNLNIKQYNAEESSEANRERQERTFNKMSWWRYYSCEMDKISDIYLNQIPIVEKQKENKEALLKSIIDKISSTNNEIVKELSDIFSESQFLLTWGKDLEKRTHETRAKWECECVRIIDKAKKTKARSDQLIQMHLKKSNKVYVLEYNKNSDTLNMPTSYDDELTVSQRAILRSVVKDGVLHLPNLFKSYAVVMSYCFDCFTNSQSNEYFQCALNDKKNVMAFMKTKSKDLLGEVFKFHLELKDGLETQDTNCSESTTGVLDVLNIPSFSMQSVTQCDFSQFWHKALEKYQFTQFQHPFKTEKTYFLADKQPSFSNISRINTSVISKGFFSSSKDRQITRKIDAKPEYMKNIEELERNMFKIADVTNKTFAAQHNMTTISRVGTDRRQSMFNQNQMKYLLTSIKKKHSEPDMLGGLDKQNKKSSKTWANLFEESISISSVLQKTQSSPNLVSDEMGEGKSRSRIDRPVSERLSGVKEINYSSFLSDLGSMPNIYSASKSSDKENCPHNHQTIIKETISIENEIKITEVPINTTPKKKIISPNSKKSVESLIDTYKKFKESRGLGGKSDSDKKNDSNSKNLADSFLEKLDLGDNKNVNKKVIKSTDQSRLSTVPDLLSPSLDFKTHIENTNS